MKEEMPFCKGDTKVEPFELKKSGDSNISVKTNNNTEKEYSEGKYRKLFHDFVNESSAGGVNKIFSPKPVLIRCIWTALCILCYGSMIYLCYGFIVVYFENPTSTYVDVTVEQDIEFPAVTICNLNKFRRSKLPKFLPMVKEALTTFRKHPPTFGAKETTENAGEEQNWEAMDKSKSIYLKRMSAFSGIKPNNNPTSRMVDSNDALQSVILETSRKYSIDDLVKAGHDFETLLVNCRWMGVACDNGYLKQLWTHNWNWKYGNCYTFNFGLSSNRTSVVPLRTSKPGPNFGLHLDIFIEQHEYIPELSQEAGVKVVIGNQMQYPFPYNEGIAISPGSATTIALRREQIEKVDQFNNNSCVKDENTMENIYSNDVLLGYTVQSCLDTCLVNQQKKECNCTDPQYPVKTGKICSSKKEAECVFDVGVRYQNDSFGCKATCPQRCRSITYRTTLSNSVISNQYQENVRQSLLKNDRFKEYVKTEDAFKQDFLRIKVYFEELNLLRIHQEFSYKMSNLLADIGGQLGLWVGLSIITFAELGDLVISLIMAMFRYD